MKIFSIQSKRDRLSWLNPMIPVYCTLNALGYFSTKKMIISINGRKNSYVGVLAIEYTASLHVADLISEKAKMLKITLKIEKADTIQRELSI